MALAAENGADRAEQLLLVTERLSHLIEEETRLIKARKPPLEGELGDEKARLANAYRLELGRIKQDRSLLDGAAPGVLSKLRQQTVKLQDALAKHEVELGAVKLVAEGLAQVMAEEVARQRGGVQNYGATGGVATPSGPIPVAVDRKA
ncbi:MAG TPA: flagellar basal-body protein FlbY [Caulobacterales bacterium]|nr:flagellar basal-body protein FlbY [Caulobacterales bacterium]